MYYNFDSFMYKFKKKKLRNLLLVNQFPYMRNCIVCFSWNIYYPLVLYSHYMHIFKRYIRQPTCNLTKFSTYVFSLFLYISFGEILNSTCFALLSFMQIQFFFLLSIYINQFTFYIYTIFDLNLKEKKIFACERSHFKLILTEQCKVQ